MRNPTIAGTIDIDQVMKIGVPKETRPGERRVAVSPESIKKFASLGFDVAVEKGAGLTASYTDEAYKQAGATIAATAKAAMDKADVVLKVDRPTPAEVKDIPKGAILACILSPFNDPEATAACAAQGVTAFAMEFMPRITRAQGMDVLSSQANLAGYRAVIDAAHEFARAFPMMMTAAGTVAPAKIFVMGAGVAGLQAIATARRLGAVVTATDVRRAAGEQVQSLGAKFIMVETAEDMETEGGYAKELSAEEQKQQAELVANHVKGQDIVITTALIPGRPAPKLITKAMVESMKPGSLVVDIAAAQGGNCELTVPDEIVDHGGVKIIGYANVPSRVAMDASALYARNLFNFLAPMVDAEKKALAVDWDDELVKGTLATRDGKVVHPDLVDVVKGGKSTAAKASSSKSTSKSVAKKPAAKSAARKSTASKSAAKPSAQPKAKAGARKTAAGKTNGKSPPSGDQNDS